MPEDLHDEYPYGYDDYYYGKTRCMTSIITTTQIIFKCHRILCAPVLMELPKLYAPHDFKIEDLVFVAVSCYMDEDEYEGFFSYKRFEKVDVGDKTEVQRGFYISNAPMVYHLEKSPGWGRKEHLDLSADLTMPQNMTLVGSFRIIDHDTKMGAFALSSPTIADIDGDGSYEVIIGMSMGIVYYFDARHMYKKNGWPIQMKGAVEFRILVEDVVGDTNLEVFLADVRGNVFCFDKQGNTILHRDLLGSIASDEEVIASNPITLGDVNGDDKKKMKTSLLLLWMLPMERA
jgi:hypothetical protein